MHVCLMNHLFPRMDALIQPQFMHQYSNHQVTLRRLFSICSNFHKLGPQYTKRLRVAMSRPILSTWSLGFYCADCCALQFTTFQISPFFFELLKIVTSRCVLYVLCLKSTNTHTKHTHETAIVFLGLDTTINPHDLNQQWKVHLIWILLEPIFGTKETGALSDFCLTLSMDVQGNWCHFHICLSLSFKGIILWPFQNFIELTWSCDWWLSSTTPFSPPTPSTQNPKNKNVPPQYIGILGSNQKNCAVNLRKVGPNYHSVPVRWIE